MNRQVHHAVQEGFQAGNEARFENQAAGRCDRSSCNGRNPAGEEQGSHPDRRLGGAPGMPHSAGLAAGLPH